MEKFCKSLEALAHIGTKQTVLTSYQISPKCLGDLQIATLLLDLIVLIAFYGSKIVLTFLSLLFQQPE